MSSVYAATPKTFTTRDDVYKRVDNLCRIASVTGPSSFSPMTGRALEIALDRIDRNKLNSTEAAELDYLYSVVSGETDYLYEEDFFKMDLKLGTNIQFNIANYKDFDFNDSENKDRRNEQMIPYRYEDAALSLTPELYFGKNVFMESDFALKNNDHHMFESSFGWLLTDYNGFSFFGSKYATAYAPELPYRAGIAFSNDYFNFIVGRYPHSIGSGITGNLIIGDNFIYQEISNLSFVSNLFTYNMSITRFDQQTEPDANNITTMSRNEFRGDQQFRVNHRFDINLFNKVRFAVDMATIYNSTYGFDVRFFYPFVIGHNYYNYDNYVEKKIFDEANNLMGFTLEATPIRGLSLSVQFALDQFQTFFEDKTSVPSAYAVLANIKYTTTMGNGTFNTWIEGVYTNPYIYLNGKLDDKGNYDYNLDYIVGYHVQYVSDIGYSGYQFGPDSLVLSLGCTYDAFTNWNIGGSLMYKASGYKGFKYHVSDVKTTNIDMSNAYFEKDYKDRVTDFLSTGWKNAEHLIQVKVNGGYEFTNYNIELFGVGCVNTYINHNFELGKIEVRPQFSFGMKWHGLN